MTFYAFLALMAFQLLFMAEVVIQRIAIDRAAMRIVASLDGIEAARDAMQASIDEARAILDADPPAEASEAISRMIAERLGHAQQ